jgi:predicted DNA-binding protein with PD1-like motif
VKARRIDEGSQFTWAVVLDRGDETVETLERFAREQGLSASSFTAIGAFSDATVGWFDPERNEYAEIPVPEQVEVLALAGDVATSAGEPAVHAHVVLGRRDGTALGGHLLRGVVNPTLEVVLTESPAQLRKRVDERTGLALIAIDETA